MFHFYNPGKSQKSKGFLTFSGVIEIKHLPKMDSNCICTEITINFHKSYF